MAIQETRLHQELHLVSPKVDFITTLEAKGRKREGMVLVIVGIDPSRNGENASVPKFWTIRERKSKLSTDKLKGQISFPADTRKVGEDSISNLGGVLAEVTDRDATLGNLYIMPSSFIKDPIVVDGGRHADLLVVILDGYNAPITPLDVEDVEPNRWMAREELQRESPLALRGIVWQAIEPEMYQQINQVVVSYFKSAQDRVPLSAIFPPGFSIVDFFRLREMKQDIIGDNNSSPNGATILFKA